MIYTYASQTDWGATDENKQTGRKWLEKQECYI